MNKRAIIKPDRCFSRAGNIHFTALKKSFKIIEYAYILNIKLTDSKRDLNEITLFSARAVRRFGEHRNLGTG